VATGAQQEKEEPSLEEGTLLLIEFLQHYSIIFNILQYEAVHPFKISNSTSCYVFLTAIVVMLIITALRIQYERRTHHDVYLRVQYIQQGD
jgi:hypothetical protein